MNFKSIKDIDLNNKTIMLRTDLNVPVQDGKVTDTTRIDRLKPTIDYLCEQNAKILAIAHFGRPKGQRVEEMSLSFIPPVLEKQWGHKVSFADDCIGASAKELAERLKPGEIGLLENLRFHKGEEGNDPAFAKDLAALADLYVNDAFSAAHRAHASTAAITDYLPAAAGLLMEAEINALGKALETPERPVMAVVGGAKISTKLDLLGNLVEKMDYLALGGGMANTFLFAQGIDMKSSLCEKDMADQARKIMEKATAAGCEIILPLDGLAATAFSAEAEYAACAIDSIPEGRMVLDIGPKTTAFLKEKLDHCKTVVWNGPMGAFEIKPFDQGTNEIASYVAQKTQNDELISVAGGGDTVAALEQAGAADGFTYISTAGGAFLEWLEGKTLPGIAALMQQKNAA